MQPTALAAHLVAVAAAGRWQRVI
ncbi:hypothetical protein ACCAA_210045 [Candidatus Accumulibacter aalborgensis]|uniref:Uncharacterized protein n=1 Tax=Candidatus Accumulibacter aalborgensis TaxID=1860102 RepID=A0A1A8XNE4_9PROT|nr:hypothetical protein ACCAA_210045 [Candidatus Accumulibacter aalborgensis]